MLRRNAWHAAINFFLTHLMQLIFKCAKFYITVKKYKISCNQFILISEKVKPSPFRGCEIMCSVKFLRFTLKKICTEKGL